MNYNYSQTYKINNLNQNLLNKYKKTKVYIINDKNIPVSKKWHNKLYIGDY